MLDDIGHRRVREEAQGSRPSPGAEAVYVHRTFAWLGRNLRLGRDYELRVQAGKALVDVTIPRLLVKRPAEETQPSPTSS
jgi:hypothetical protein